MGIRVYRSSPGQVSKEVAATRVKAEEARSEFEQEPSPTRLPYKGQWTLPRASGPNATFALE